MQLILASSSEGRKKLLSLLKIPFTVIASEIDEEKIVGKTPLETLKLRAKLKAEDVAQKLFSSPKSLKLLKKLTPKNASPATAGSASTGQEQLLILSADSGGIVGNKLFGKPKDYKEAVKMLSFLSGKTHQFVTAIYMLKISRLLLSEPPHPRARGFPSVAGGGTPHRPAQRDWCWGNLSDLSDLETYNDHAVSRVTFRKLSKEEIKRYLSLTKYTRFACGYTLFASPQDFITKIEGSLSNVVGLPLEKVKKHIQT